MDSEHHEEPTPSEKTESSLSHHLSWEALLHRLGYTPTTEMRLLADESARTRLAGEIETSKDLLADYYDKAIDLIEALPEELYRGAQLAHLISIANIKSAGGDVNAAIEDLNDALLVAEMGRLDQDLAPIIRAEIARLSNSPSSPEEVSDTPELSTIEIIEKCQDILADEMSDDEGRAEWNGLDIPDLIGGLIGLLYEQGETDPEYFLRTRGIIE